MSILKSRHSLSELNSEGVSSKSHKENDRGGVRGNVYIFCSITL